MWPEENWHSNSQSRSTSKKHVQYWGGGQLPFSQRRTDFDSVWVQTNCIQGSGETPAGQSRRVELVLKLSEGGRVARLGECLNNAAFMYEEENKAQHTRTHPKNWSGGYRGLEKDRGKQDQSLSKFKFMLAFENNLCDHYLTEKVWKAYALGVVPVVLAGGGAVEALPADDSYINVADYQTVGELREFLHTVANDETLYMRYFEWKQRPLSELNPAFQQLWRSQVRRPLRYNATVTTYILTYLLVYVSCARKKYPNCVCDYQSCVA